VVQVFENTYSPYKKIKIKNFKTVTHTSVLLDLGHIYSTVQISESADSTQIIIKTQPDYFYNDQHNLPVSLSSLRCAFLGQ